MRALPGSAGDAEREAGRIAFFGEARLGQRRESWARPERRMVVCLLAQPDLVARADCSGRIVQTAVATDLAAVLPRRTLPGPRIAVLCARFMSVSFGSYLMESSWTRTARAGVIEKICGKLVRSFGTNPVLLASVVRFLGVRRPGQPRLAPQLSPSAQPSVPSRRELSAASISVFSRSTAKR